MLGLATTTRNVKWVNSGENMFSIAWRNVMQFCQFLNQICNRLAKYLYIKYPFLEVKCASDSTKYGNNWPPNGIIHHCDNKILWAYILYVHYTLTYIAHLLFYRNIQCFTMAMPFNMILTLYVIPCKLSCDFSKLTILYIHVHYILSFLWQISQ